MQLSWQDHVTNQELYGHLQKLSSVVRERRMRIKSRELCQTQSLYCGSRNMEKQREEGQTTPIFILCLSTLGL